MEFESPAVCGLCLAPAFGLTFGEENFGLSLSDGVTGTTGLLGDGEENFGFSFSGAGVFAGDIGEENLGLLVDGAGVDGLLGDGEENLGLLELDGGEDGLDEPVLGFEELLDPLLSLKSGFANKQKATMLTHPYKKQFLTSNSFKRCSNSWKV